ncbi:hypothetical protein C4K12_1936 [Pseudomonas chlororaphis subsp. aureofaciens]|nr:hypothetical protein C4K12_1936 [Pseudomonas chlororaphis subsp. aureofaciens]
MHPQGQADRIIFYSSIVGASLLAMTDGLSTSLSSLVSLSRASSLLQGLFMI